MSVIVLLLHYLLGAQSVNGAGLHYRGFARKLLNCSRQQMEARTEPCKAMNEAQGGSMTDYPNYTTVSCQALGDVFWICRCYHAAYGSCPGPLSPLITDFLQEFKAFQYLCEIRNEIDLDCITSKHSECSRRQAENRPISVYEKPWLCKYLNEEMKCYLKSGCAYAYKFAEFLNRRLSSTCKGWFSKLVSAISGRGNGLTHPSLVSFFLLRVVTVVLTRWTDHS